MEAIEAVVSFWVAQLHPSRRDLAPAFGAALREWVAADVAKGGTAHLSVDYDPFGPLLDALRTAGIACRGSMFSADGVFVDHCRKTYTTIKNGRAFAKRGYGASEQPIAMAAPSPDPEGTRGEPTSGVMGVMRDVLRERS